MKNLVNVTITPSKTFFAKHEEEQARIDQSSPEVGMRARLRPYFPIAFGYTSTIFSIEEDHRVVAIAEAINAVDDDPQPPRLLTLSYVSVDEQYRSKGYASALVAAIVTYMKSQDMTTLNSSYYTDLGSRYLKPVLRKIVAEGILLQEDGHPYHGPAPMNGRPR
jgi:GNAT superfamily N-acetyltransferase